MTIPFVAHRISIFSLKVHKKVLQLKWHLTLNLTFYRSPQTVFFSLKHCLRV